VPFSPVHDSPSELLTFALTKLTQWTIALQRAAIKIFGSDRMKEGELSDRDKKKISVFQAFLKKMKKINVHV